MGYIISILIALSYSFACLSLGAFVVPMLMRAGWQPYSEKPIIAVGTYFIIGQAILAASLQLLAVASSFRPTYVIGLLIISAIIGVKPSILVLWHLLWKIWQIFRQWIREPFEWKVLIALTGFLIAIMAMGTLTPPMARGDAIAFYLAFPKLIAASGTFPIMPAYGTFSQIGLQGEFHAAALLLLDNTPAAKFFPFVVSIAAAFMLWGLGKQIGLGFRGQWLLLICVFTSTGFTNVIWDGKTDIFGAAVGIAAYYWAFQLTGEWQYDRKVLALVGLLSGFAIIAKISYAVFLPMTIIFIVSWRTVSGKPLFSKPTVYALSIVLVMLGFWSILPAIPQMIKNEVVFNEPLSPFVILNDDPSAAEGARAIREQAWFSAATTRKIVLTYPFSLVYGNYWAQAGALSPLFLALPPLILFLPPSRRFWHHPLFQVTTVAIMSILIWIILRPSVFAPRYMMPPLLFLFLPGIYAVERFLQHKPNSILSAGLIITILFALLIAIGSARWLDVSLYRYPIGLMRGKVGECDREFVNNDGSCRIGNILEEQAAPGAQVLLGSYYSYWLRDDLLQCYSPQEVVYSRNTPIERWERLYQQGFEYIIIDTLTHAPVRDMLPLTETPEWLNVEVLFDESTFLLYHLQATNPPYAPGRRCEKQNSQRWELVQVEQES